MYCSPKCIWVSVRHLILSFIAEGTFAIIHQHKLEYSNNHKTYLGVDNTEIANDTGFHSDLDVVHTASARLGFHYTGYRNLIAGCSVTGGMGLSPEGTSHQGPQRHPC